MRGFTLLETLVVMLIVALLSTMAVLGYRQAIHKTRRIEARLALLHIQFLQERHYANHFTYARTLDGAPDAGGLGSATQTHNGDYMLSVETSADAQRYTAHARANPSGRQAADAPCQQFSIDSAGAARSAPADGPWRTDAQVCWN